MKHQFEIFVLATPSVLSLIHLLANWTEAKGKFTKLVLLLIPLIGPVLYFFLAEMLPPLPPDELNLKARGNYGGFGTRWDDWLEERSKKVARAKISSELKLPEQPEQPKDEN